MHRVIDNLQRQRAVHFFGCGCCDTNGKEQCGTHGQGIVRIEQIEPPATLYIENDHFTFKPVLPWSMEIARFYPDGTWRHLPWSLTGELGAYPAAHHRVTTWRQNERVR